MSEILRTSALPNMEAGSHRFWSETRRGWAPGYGNSSEQTEEKFTCCSCGAEWQHFRRYGNGDVSQTDREILHHRITALNDALSRLKA